MPPRHVAFVGGESGSWKVDSVQGVKGDSLPIAKWVDVIEGSDVKLPRRSAWTLKGVVSNLRYATRDEMKQLGAKQEGLGRPDATCAALIPIKKTEAWWALSQDERTQVMLRGKHTELGLEYLPAVARALHHSRDIPGESFDFITWFEYAPDAREAFEEMLVRLRATEEWMIYVEREVDIRLTKTDNANPKRCTLQ
jgi:chlorite dismutase